MASSGPTKKTTPQEALKRFKAILNPTQADWKRFYADTAGGPVFEKALLDRIIGLKFSQQRTIIGILSSSERSAFLRGVTQELINNSQLDWASKNPAEVSKIYNQLVGLINETTTAYKKDPQNPAKAIQAAQAWHPLTAALLIKGGPPVYQAAAAQQLRRTTTVARSSTVPKQDATRTLASSSRAAPVESSTKSIKDQAQALWKQIAPQVEASLKQTGATVKQIAAFSDGVLTGLSRNLVDGITHQYDDRVKLAYRLRDTFTPWGGESIEQLLDRVAYDAGQNIGRWKDKAWSATKGAVNGLTDRVDTAANFLVDGKRQQQALDRAAVITPRLLSLLGTAVQKDPQQAGHVFGAIITGLGLVLVGGGGGYAFARSQQAKKIAGLKKSLEGIENEQNVLVSNLIYARRLEHAKHKSLETLSRLAELDRTGKLDQYALGLAEALEQVARAARTPGGGDYPLEFINPTQAYDIGSILKYNIRSYLDRDQLTHIPRLNEKLIFMLDKIAEEYPNFWDNFFLEPNLESFGTVAKLLKYPRHGPLPNGTATVTAEELSGLASQLEKALLTIDD